MANLLPHCTGAVILLLMVGGAGKGQPSLPQHFANLDHTTALYVILGYDTV